MSKVKLLFLAIDGLDYDLVHKYDCSFLRWLTEGNQHGVLISDDPSGCDRHGSPMTGPAWTTIYTGVPAWVHGLDCQNWFQGGSAGFELDVPTIWTMLQREQAGGYILSVGLMALPVLAPSHRVMPWFNGWAINGFPCVGEIKAGDYYPGDLAFPHFLPDFRLEEFAANMANLPALAFLVESRQEQVEAKLDLALALPRNDVMAIGVQMVDWVSHSQLDRGEAYAFIDKWVNRAYTEFRPENFVICSDHGFEENQKKHRETGFYVCSLLGGETPRTIYDVAPLTLFIMGR